MSSGPAAPPPSTGPPIGLVGGDRSYQPDIIACAVVTAVISSVFVGLRFYTRGHLLHVLGWDDWLLLLAQVCLPRLFRHPHRTD